MVLKRERKATRIKETEPLEREFYEIGGRIAFCDDDKYGKFEEEVKKCRNCGG